MKVKKILSFLTGTVMAFTLMLSVPMNQEKKNACTEYYSRGGGF